MVCRMFLLGVVLFSSQAFAAQVMEKQIPDEYESNSAFSASMNNAGYAANDPHSAIRANPALLGTQKSYSVAAGYHWPVSGRDYYQASVVDTKTSPIAAGVSYTGFMDDYKYNGPENATAPRFDSPLQKRGVIAVSHAIGGGSAGIGATYIRANPVSSSDDYREGKTTIQGTGLNLGFAYPMTNQLILGAAAENLSNSKIKDYVPRTQKVGFAYTGDGFVANLDARQRERVAQFESKPVSLTNPTPEDLDPERMVLATVTAKLQQYLKITGSYGQSLTDNRKQLGGGISLESQNFVLSYTANRPYLATNSAHQSIALTLDISM